MSTTVAWGPVDVTGAFVYHESAARNRDLHVLLQDLTGVAPTRRQFLLHLLRECVERFGERGRIEHPLALAREIATTAEGLARRADSRVDDPAGLDVVVVLRHGETAWVLAARESVVRVRTDDAWHSLRDVAAELPMNERPQRDLFGRSMADALGLWRLDDAGGRTIVAGGLDAENALVCEALSSPAALAPGGEGGELPGVGHRVVALRLDPARPVRGVAMPARGARTSPAAARNAAVGAVAVALIALSGWGVWRAERALERGRDAATLAMGQDARRAHTTAGHNAEAPRDAVRPGAREREAGAGEANAASQRGSAAVPDTASATGAGSEANVALAPRWTLEFSRPVTTTPLVLGDLVVFGTREGLVRAVEAATGRERWRVDTREGVGASPVPIEGDVVVADYAGDVLRIDARGRRVWKRNVGAHVGATPTVAGDVVVVSGFDGRVHGLDARTGRVRWRVRTGGRVRARAARSGAVVVVPSYDGIVRAIRARDGRVAWKRRIGVRMAASPTVAGDRAIVGADDGRVIALDVRSGAPAWTHRERAPVRSFLVSHDGAVYVGADDGSVVCLDAATGRPRWRAHTGGRVMSQPAVVGTLVLVSSYDARLHVFDAATGAELATHPLGAPAFSSPVAAGDAVVVGTNGGRLVCLSLSGAPAM